MNAIIGCSREGRSQIFPHLWLNYSINAIRKSKDIAGRHSRVNVHAHLEMLKRLKIGDEWKFRDTKRWNTAINCLGKRAMRNGGS